jgi:uroporphyrinogen-III synthase
LISGDELEQEFHSSEIQILRIPVFETGFLSVSKNLEQLMATGDYCLFSSPRAVDWFKNQGFKIRPPIICFGSKTAEALNQAGLQITAIGAGNSVLKFISESFFQKRIIHFCSAQTRLEPSDLKGSAIDLINIPVYAPEMLLYQRPQIEVFVKQIALAEGLLFFSGSAVRYFSKLFRDQIDLLKDKLCLASGDSAAKELQVLGVSQIRQTAGPETEKMVLLIRQCYE